MNAIKAAVVYFACVFAFGFALGAARILLLAPRIGVLLAVCIELPMMLFVSWLLCRRTLREFSVERNVGPRIAIGAVAFILLMSAEIGLSTLVFRRAIGEYFADFATAAGMLGLAGQILFALFPVIQLFVPQKKS